MEKLSAKIILYIIAVMTVLALLGYYSAAFAYAEENSRAELSITALDKTFVYRDEYIEPSDFTVKEEIDKRRINAPIDEKIELVDHYISKGASYKTALEVCFPRLKNTVNDVAEYMYIQERDAGVVYSDKTFSVKSEVNGRVLDENRLYAAIYYTLKYSGGGTVKAPTVVVRPQVSGAYLRAELNNIGAYTTDYSTSTDARAHNITLALSRFDGYEIAPGESVSFNTVVGARTEESGFKKAKVIVDGKYTDGVGGGVCQASTALYNAALLAGLSATANAHSICPSYCPPGLDAMISEFSDLVIKNTSERTVRISVKSWDKQTRVEFYGQKLNYKIEPESVVLKTVEFDCIESVDTDRRYFDSSAVCGDRRLVAVGKNGVVSETYLNYYDLGGKLIKRVKIRTNEYKSTPQVIAVAP